MLELQGTTEADVISIRREDSLVVTINGIDSRYVPTDVVEINVHGYGGNDVLTFTGTSESVTAILRPTSLDLTGQSFALHADEFEKIRVFGGVGSQDIAYFYDSAGIDRFIGRPNYALMTGEGFYNYATGFDKVYAYATEGNAMDRAYLYDSVGNDRFIGRPDSALMTGDGFYNYAANFDAVYANATAGDAGDVGDRAYLYDSMGSDRFDGRPDFALMRGSGFYNNAAGFDKVYAYATPGIANDRAYLYDSTGNDRFIGRPDSALMTGDSFYNYAANFDAVYANATAGDTGGVGDLAYLYDSMGNDRFVGRPDSALLRGDGFYNNAAGFDKVYAYATPGIANDRAYLYDSAGNDRFIGRPDSALMSGDGFYNYAANFDAVFASATAGDVGDVGDRAYLYDSIGVDRFVGRPDYGLMSGDGFYNRAAGFDNVYGYATAGIAKDRAYLYDSVGDDSFHARPGRSVLTGVGFNNEAISFDKVYGYASEGNDIAKLDGTNLNDTFYFKPFASWMVGFAGDYFNAKGFDETYGDGGLGQNLAYFYDSPGEEIYIGQAKTGSIRGSDYFARASNAAQLIVRMSAGGTDEVVLYDSPDDDFIRVQPGFSQFATAAAVHSIYGATTVNAYASYGGNDGAVIYGSVEAESLTAAQEWVVYAGPSGTVKTRLGGFATIRAYSSASLAVPQAQDTSVLGDDRDISLQLVGNWLTQNRDANTFPLLLDPDVAAAERFDYAPDFTLNEVTFDSLNRPYIRSRTGSIDETSFIHTLRDDQWVELEFISAIQSAYPDFHRTVLAGGWTDSRIVFDLADRLYTIVTIELTDGGLKNVLLSSASYGASFEVHELPAGRYRFEHWVGHNQIDGPPFLAFFQELVPHSEFAAYYRLLVVQPRYESGTLVIPPPIAMTDTANYNSQHSGGSSFAVTRDGKTHFVWADTTPEDLGGSPIYVATYDHATQTVAERQLLGYVSPANNAHNTPVIAMDSQGYLHVIAGVEEFQYFRSLTSNDAYDGWTPSESILTSGWRGPETDVDGLGRQTYPSFLIDMNDTAHLMFRQWRRSVDQYHLGRTYGALSYQSKPVGGAWSDARPLVIPARDDYSIYYQKLAIDLDGNLFLSLSYLSRFDINNPGLRPDRYYDRMIIISTDGGVSWRLTETEDFAH